MVGVLVTALVVGGLVVFLLGGVLAAMGRPPGNVVLVVAALLEVLVLVQVVAAFVGLIRGERPAELLVFVLYLIGTAVVMPLVVLWSIAERNRWSNLVIGIGGLTVMAMVARLAQLWQVQRG